MDFGVRPLDLGLRVQDLGFRIQSLGFRVTGSGFTEVGEGFASSAISASMSSSVAWESFGIPRAPLGSPVLSPEETGSSRSFRVPLPSGDDLKPKP